MEIPEPQKPDSNGKLLKDVKVDYNQQMLIVTRLGWLQWRQMWEMSLGGFVCRRLDAIGREVSKINTLRQLNRVGLNDTLR